jgi:hypothetical protein
MDSVGEVRWFTNKKMDQPKVIKTSECDDFHKSVKYIARIRICIERYPELTSVSIRMKSMQHTRT